MRQRPTRWLVPPCDPGARRHRLFCFHHSGGGATAFRGWPGRLAPDVAVHAVQLPGREGRLGERTLTNMAAAVSAVADVLKPAIEDADGYSLLGHSMGAILAFEVARQLHRKTGKGPTILVVSGHDPPHLPSTRTPVASPGVGLSHLPDDELLALLERYNGTNAAVLANADLRNLILPLLRADFRLMESHAFQPEPKVDCPILVLSGRDDPLVTPAHLERFSELTTAGATLVWLPGDHFFLRTSEAEACRCVASFLAHVRAAEPSVRTARRM